jgi:hypothetical protein
MRNKRKRNSFDVPQLSSDSVRTSNATGIDEAMQNKQSKQQEKKHCDIGTDECFEPDMVRVVEMILKCYAVQNEHTCTCTPNLWFIICTTLTDDARHGKVPVKDFKDLHAEQWIIMVHPRAPNTTSDLIN